MRSPGPLRRPEFRRSVGSAGEAGGPQILVHEPDRAGTVSGLVGSKPPVATLGYASVVTTGRYLHCTRAPGKLGPLHRGVVAGARSNRVMQRVLTPAFNALRASAW